MPLGQDSKIADMDQKGNLGNSRATKYQSSGQQIYTLKLQKTPTITDYFVSSTNAEAHSDPIIDDNVRLVLSSDSVNIARERRDNEFEADFDNNMEFGTNDDERIGNNDIKKLVDDNEKTGNNKTDDEGANDNSDNNGTDNNKKTDDMKPMMIMNSNLPIK
ncbi:12079_t:CDS:2 [Ambispora gerdemannii]|uniref:12079_t:CDS:1 n=1 Tax=Ambispora gerdemannii TaxID=144530 RepID=A0A9N8VWD8_9GLOM|nr:12079_t:CDS:2 [Ambispora gerdemannii]